MHLSRRLVLAAALLAAARPAQSQPAPDTGLARQGAGDIVRLDPALDTLIDPDARLEVLGEGYSWSEGPVWIAEGDYLLFSDVPQNRIHRWSEQDGTSIFMDPSGHAGPNTTGFREPGSNGLIPGPAGSILMADHGNRAIARVDLASRAKTLLATHHAGRRFNSPNDVVQASSGAILFTDPPYGLMDLDRSPFKEMPHNGVYRLDPDGTITLLESGLTFPNGIGLSPDQSTLYVAVSDPARPVIMAYDLDDHGQTSSGRVLKDFTDVIGAANPGLPDGMAFDRQGHLFATGPGGVHILRPDGHALGCIDTGGAAANCTFGADGKTLFITAGSRLLSLRTLTSG